jgi:hypothetical protein
MPRETVPEGEAPESPGARWTRLYAEFFNRETVCARGPIESEQRKGCESLTETKSMDAIVKTFPGKDGETPDPSRSRRSRSHAAAMGWR